LIEIEHADKSTPMGPEPTVCLSAAGSHDVGRLLNLLAGGVATIEHVEAANRLVRGLKRTPGGKAALTLLREQGGPDFVGNPPGEYYTRYTPGTRIPKTEVYADPRGGFEYHDENDKPHWPYFGWPIGFGNTFAIGQDDEVTGDTYRVTSSLSDQDKANGGSNRTATRAQVAAFGLGVLALTRRPNASTLDLGDGESFSAEYEVRQDNGEVDGFGSLEAARTFRDNHTCVATIHRRTITTVVVCSDWEELA
jgi:hypothetical protein